MLILQKREDVKENKELDNTVDPKQEESIKRILSQTRLIKNLKQKIRFQ